MIVVHHLNNSRSQRVLWLLEELDIPYEVKRYERDVTTMLAPPELRAVHPLGKSPVITDGNVTVAESGAIMEYLVERHGQGRLAPPAGTPERLRYTYWLHFAEGSAMPPLLLSLVFDRVRKQSPFLVRPITAAIASKVARAYIDPTINTQLEFMEFELGRSPWFAGNSLSAADVQMSFPLEAAVTQGYLGRQRPRLMDLLTRMHERPAYRRALERGGESTLSTKATKQA